MGPAAILTYALTGILLILVMRMLGEMAVARPSVGSFSDYSRMGSGTGPVRYRVAVLVLLVIVVGIEAIAGAGIVAQYTPGIPTRDIALALIVVLTLTNLYSVRSYSEFEFWFASIKVVAIILFIVVGFLFAASAWPASLAESPGLVNFYGAGGFAPGGIAAIFASIATAIFAFVGAEVVSIAAAESDEPERGVARAVNQVVYRVLLFYVLSLFLVAAIVPWNTLFAESNPTNPGIVQSPFSVALENMGDAVALFVYLLIAVSELRMRARLKREDPERLQVRIWLYPYLTYLSIFCILAVFVLMALNPNLRTQLILTLVSVGVVLLAYVLRSRFGAPSRTEETASGGPAR